ncbi:MAG: hypothetical protein KF819_38810 [Labilithrix sp.]|nr:hypothetical protein [Labilithrix sp.]
MARRLTVSLGLGFAAFAFAAGASAAPRYVDRGITGQRYVFAGDVGLGLVHSRIGNNDAVGAGLNLEGSFAVSHSVELGVRTGARFGTQSQLRQADQYGRTLWTETWGTGNGAPFANPEIRVRWAAYSGRVVEVGLDWRMYVPGEAGTSFGLGFGAPLAFHVGDILRIDTGIYIPVVFDNPASTVISAPAYFWFQASPHVWLGPMIGVRHVNPPGPSRDDILLGFGIGYQVASAVDLKWMFLMPRVNDDNRAFGVGFGVQFRIGE